MVEDNDVVLLISNSGETDEILRLIPFFHFQSCGFPFTGICILYSHENGDNSAREW